MKIRYLTSADQGEWTPLFREYRTFHELPVDSAVEGLVWSWLMDEAHPTTGLVAEIDNHVRGFVHFRVSPRSIAGDMLVNLDDLFTDVAFRGRRIATHLIESTAREGRERGLNEVQWVTNGWNTAARNFYRKIATETDWVTFQQVFGRSADE